MTTRIIYSALCVIFFSGLSVGQEVFHRSYGGTGDDYGRAVAICAAGGYIVAGSTNSFINSSTDVYLLRIDDAGEFLWGKNIGEPNLIEWGIDVVEDVDGNLYIAGYTNNSDGNAYDGMLLKTDSEGNPLWTKTFGGEDWDFFHEMEIDEAGNIYLVGSTTSAAGQQGWILKTDPDGIIIWESFVTIPGITSIHGISLCTDGRLAFVGALSSYDPVAKTIIAGLMEPDGNIVWNESYPELGDAEANGCVCDWHDDVIKLMGTTGEMGGDNISMMIIAGIDIAENDVVWSDIFGEIAEDQGWAIDVKDNGTLVVCGAISNAGFGYLDAYMSEKTAQGAYIGLSNGFVFGDENNEMLFDIAVTPDGGYITVGETNSFGNNYQAYVVKIGPNNEADTINSNFLDITTTSFNTISAEIKIYPNPATYYINIETPSSVPVQTRLIDSSGRIVHNEFVKENGILELPQNLETGIYLVELKNADFYYCTKLIIHSN